MSLNVKKHAAMLCNRLYLNELGCVLRFTQRMFDLFMGKDIL